MDQNLPTTYQVTGTPKSAVSTSDGTDNSNTPVPPTPRSGKTISKKQLLIGGIGLAIVIVLIVGVNWYFNLPINQLKKALNNENISLAVQVYQTNVSDSAFTEKALSAFSAYVAEEESKYMEQSIEYELATANLNAVAEIHDVTDVLQRMDNVESSRQTFDKAEATFADGKFADAIPLYKKVIEEDEENFEAAQSRIEESITAISDAAIAEANTALKDNDYIKAFEALSSMKDDYANDKVQQLKAQVLSDADTEILATAQDKIDAGDYSGAYQYIKTWPEEMLSQDASALQESAINSFAEKAYTEADALAQQKDYAGAISSLKTSIEMVPLPNAQQKIDAYQKEIDKNTLASYKSKVDVNYDSIDNSYAIDLAGDIFIDYNRNIFPAIISFDNDFSSMGLMVGFMDNDWIFVDKILFDCNGVQFTYELDYNDVTRDVGWGYILEITPLIHSTNNNLADLISALQTSQAVTIRFTGSGGRKDVTIPKAHCQEIQMMWEISQALGRNPDLISVLSV